MKVDVLDKLDELMMLNDRVEVLCNMLIDELVIPRAEDENAPEVLARSIRDISHMIANTLDETYHMDKN